PGGGADRRGRAHQGRGRPPALAALAAAGALLPGERGGGELLRPGQGPAKRPAAARGPPSPLPVPLPGLRGAVQGGRRGAGGGELELMTLTDSIAKELGRYRTHDADTLSPSGERPSDSLVSGRTVGPLLVLSAAAVLLAVAIYAGLWLTLKVSVGSSADEISA